MILVMGAQTVICVHWGKSVGSTGPLANPSWMLHGFIHDLLQPCGDGWRIKKVGGRGYDDLSQAWESLCSGMNIAPGQDWKWFLFFEVFLVLNTRGTSTLKSKCQLRWQRRRSNTKSWVVNSQNFTIFTVRMSALAWAIVCITFILCSELFYEWTITVAPGHKWFSKKNIFHVKAVHDLIFIHFFESRFAGN